MDSDELRWTEPSEEPGVGTLAGASVGPELDADFDAGARLGRYVVLQRMGAGGMGVVYAAYDPQLDRRIALKLMHQRGDDEDQAERASQRMLAEAKAMAQLSHPNVITVHDVGTIDRRVFIAMEFVEGEPLSSWMRTKGRTWQELLEVFVKAGRGLEAAHAVNLVHRDFKPDNVLVGADGRVRVLDFGLARRLDGTLEPNDRRGDREAGTPAYMSPEQHLGSALDHRADQFSFCVALYEALYGELPFAAKTRLELALAVTDGRVGPAPKRASVPNWLRWVLLRGLDPDPEGRYPDMGELLTELGRDPKKRWRNVAMLSAGGLASVALVVGSVMAYRARVPVDGPGTTVEPVACSVSAGEELAEVWGPERSAAVAESFAKVGASWATDLSPEVTAGLDTWANGWASMHTEACEDTRSGRQSDSMLDRRMLCLAGARAEFAGLVDVLTSGEAESVTRAVEAVRGLPALDACTVAALEQGAPAVERSEEDQAAIAAIERDLGRAHSLELTGGFTDAEAASKRAAAAATELDEPGLLARALFIQARVVAATGQRTAASTLFDEAEFAAERAGIDRLRADIFIEHARLHCKVGDALAANSYLREARAVLDRINRIKADALEEAVFLGVSARAQIVAGEFGEAEKTVRDAIASLADIEPPPVELAELHATLGVVLRERGSFADARVQLERAKELWARVYGERHPTIASVHHELALTYHREGRHAKAVLDYQRALEVFEEVYGPRTLEVARASAGLVVCLAELDRYDESLRESQRARSIFRELGDTAQVDLGRALDAEGSVQARLGQHKQAAVLHRQGATVLEGAKAANKLVANAELAQVLGHVGAALLADERPLEAREALDEALELLADADVVSLAAVTAELQILAAHAWAIGDEADLTRARELAASARVTLVAEDAGAAIVELDAWLGTL